MECIEPHKENSKKNYKIQDRDHYIFCCNIVLGGSYEPHASGLSAGTSVLSQAQIARNFSSKTLSATLAVNSLGQREKFFPPAPFLNSIFFQINFP